LLRVTEAASGPDSTDVAETLIEIAGILHFHLFRLQEAEVVLARLLSLREKLHDANHPAVALALNYLAQLQTDLHKFSVSEPLLLRALAIQEGRLEPDHLNVALTLNNLSVLYFKLGRFTQAEPLIRRTIAIREKQLGRDDPATTLSLDNLARNLNQQGRHSEADTIYREVLAIREKTLGGDHPEVANSLINLAGTLYEMRRMHELEPLYSRALSISENGLGADHPDVADVLSSFGAALAELGRCPEALRLHDNHPSIAISLNNISACVSPAEAEPLQMRALQITQKAYGVAHPEVAIRLHQLASNYHTQRRYLDADATYRRALEVRLATLPEHHPSVALTLNNLAALKYDEGNWLEAVEFARRAGQVAIDRARLTSAMTEKPMSGAAEAELMRGTAEFNWLIRSAWRLAQQQPSTLRELTEETFAAAQRSAQTSAGSAVAQMAARFARGSGELSSLVREQQTISALLREFDKRIVALRSEAPDKRPEGLEASITRQTMDAEQRLTSVTSRLAKDFPEYAAVSAPEPLTMQMVQNYLRSDEALVLFGFVGSETHLWAINTDAVRWVRLPVPTQKIEEIVPALRCGLDQSLWNGMEPRRRSPAIVTPLMPSSSSVSAACIRSSSARLTRMRPSAPRIMAIPSRILRSTAAPRPFNLRSRPCRAASSASARLAMPRSLWSLTIALGLRRGMFSSSKRPVGNLVRSRSSGSSVPLFLSSRMRRAMASPMPGMARNCERRMTWSRGVTSVRRLSDART
jgi:tetratricopeptide (TPR) repeat protein